MSKNKFVQPVLKWVGGKRQLIPEIEKYFPNTREISTYYEPFVGGGAVLFHFQPKKAVINDINEELINLYKVIKNDVDLLIEDLKTYKNNEKLYYEVRALDRTPEFKNLTNIQRASRTHFLNKTCYNGLYRVNSSGEFNTPFGKYKNPDIVNETVLKAVSIYFNKSNMKILNGDYEESLKGIRKGAFVYFDPPYDPVSSSSSFTGYSEGGFDREEQTRLKKVCDKLNNKGVKFLLSNSATGFVKELYQDYDINIVQAKRSVNSVASKRGKVDEVLIKNYD
jgi:DNA adenine methylase